MKLRRRSASGRNPDLAGREIDQAFDDVSRLRPSGAAIGIDRNGIGIDAAHAHVAGGNVIDAGRQAGAEVGNIRCELREIRAHVGDEIDIEREEAMPLVERQARRGDVVAALGVAEEMLGAVGDPGHRLAQKPVRRTPPAHIRDSKKVWCRIRRQRPASPPAASPPAHGEFR